MPVLAIALLLALATSAAQASDFALRLPLGLQEQAAWIPDDNPLTAEKIALGKQLFWDKRWSRNGTVACVSCHDPNHGWGDPRQFSLRFQGKARCTLCHAGFNFTDEGFHNIGVGMDAEKPDLGRFTVTKVDAHKGAFKTPTLRDAAQRPPYMHDGSLKTLGDVVAFYNRGGTPNPWLAVTIQPLNLTAAEQQDLVAFLESLTGQVAREISSPPTLPD